MAKTMTDDDMVEEFGTLTDELRTLLNGWLARGEGVAIYRNDAFDHTDFGTFKFASFGSELAAFEGDPPQQLPDTTDAINWPYQLMGTFRGERLPEVVPHEWATPAEVLGVFVRNFDVGVVDQPTWPWGRIVSYLLTVAEDRMSISARVLTVNGETAQVWLNAAMNRKHMVDRIGEFEWRLRLPRRKATSARIVGLGPAHVQLYNGTLDKEEGE